ncbi:hypothetical protein CN234_21640 [Sinorhizobium meliloti]|uniref:hypothetical protein n=1 Tax=Rhizobium meliloti TaxID=382 RepID=UPI000FD90E25|nr:hypothetical protein [Sinorhizobium meliloti]RVG06615.1 hypothetical protein CN234_21640 [Sinorhizobium meliloti]
MADDVFDSRRNFLKFGMYSSVFGAGVLLSSSGYSQVKRLDQLVGILGEAARIQSWVEENRSYREAFQIPVGGALEQAPTRARPSKTPISQRATSLIVSFEVSSPEMYQARYTKPVWPKGESGVTIGIGYDIGYTRATDLRKDWAGYLDDGAIDSLLVACGVRGSRARPVAGELRNVVVPWDVALKQYQNVMQPRYVGIAERALPNFKDLSEDCRGALVSLVYNRGASFGIPEHRDRTGRYKEMRNIKAAMTKRDYVSVPQQIRAMKRLWNVSELPGLHKRRDAEAVLFEIGLGMS